MIKKTVPLILLVGGILAAVFLQFYVPGFACAAIGFILLLNSNSKNAAVKGILGLVCLVGGAFLAYLGLTQDFTFLIFAAVAFIVGGILWSAGRRKSHGTCSKCGTSLRGVEPAVKASGRRWVGKNFKTDMDIHEYSFTVSAVCPKCHTKKVFTLTFRDDLRELPSDQCEKEVYAIFGPVNPNVESQYQETSSATPKLEYTNSDLRFYLNGCHYQTSPSYEINAVDYEVTAGSGWNAVDVYANFQTSSFRDMSTDDVLKRLESELNGHCSNMAAKFGIKTVNYNINVNNSYKN